MSRARLAAPAAGSAGPWIFSKPAIDEYFAGLIDEVRIYNIVQNAAQIQTDMNTPVGAAATGATARRMQASSVPKIQKLAVGDCQTVDDVTVTSDLTPQLTTWLAGGRDGEAKVEVEITRKPTKSVKAGKVTFDKRLIWSGHATAKPGDSRVTLQVPIGQIDDGEKVRWRARVGASGSWSSWHDLVVDTTSKIAEATSRPTSAAMPLALNDDDARVKDCWDNEEEARKSKKDRTDGTDGYHAGRSNWCAIQPVAGSDAKYAEKELLVNGLTATATIIGYTYANGPGNNSDLRRSHFKISLRDVTPVPLGGV